MSDIFDELAPTFTNVRAIDEPAMTRAVNDTRAGWDLMFSHARVIALLPLETWLEALELGESCAAVVDPTLYRDYLRSGKGDAIKQMIKACLVVKKTFVELRDDALAGKIKK